MMMALLALLVITMVSTVVIRAATANVGRTRSGKAEEQAFLTVSSAASVLREGMQGKVYSRYLLTTRTDTLTEKGEVSAAGEPESVNIQDWSDADGVGNPDIPLRALLQNMAEKIIDGEGDQTAQLTVEVAMQDGVLQPVAAELTMYADHAAPDDDASEAFSVSVDLHLQDAGQSDARLTLKIPAAAEQIIDRTEERDYVGEGNVKYRETQYFSEQWEISGLGGSISLQKAAGEGGGA